MKILGKYILPAYFFILNQIKESNAQFFYSDLDINIPFSPYAKAAKSSQNVITEQQLNSFSYGAEQFKLAIIGDSGTEKEANEVMKLTSFDALLHLGDYDYSCKPDKYFDNVLDSRRKYQFMGVLGNHDAKHECSDSEAERFTSNVYREMTNSKNSKVKCEFSSSKFMWACKYKNMVNILRMETLYLAVILIVKVSMIIVKIKVLLYSVHMIMFMQELMLCQTLKVQPLINTIVTPMLTLYKFVKVLP
eukprot:jgi/Orpsp1_1/1186252/evm.model.d7180000049206.1